MRNFSTLGFGSTALDATRPVMTELRFIAVFDERPFAEEEEPREFFEERESFSSTLGDAER